MSFALIESGTFGGMPAKMKVLGGSILRDSRILDVTGAADNAASVFTTGRPVWQANLRSVYNSSGSTFDLPIGGTTTGNPLEKMSRVILRRDGHIQNITGSDDALVESTWILGTVTWSGQATGWASNADTVHSNITASGGAITTLALPISGTVLTTGAAQITTYNVGIPYSRGGMVPVQFGFVYTGTVTATILPILPNSFPNLFFDLNLGNGTTQAWSGVTIIPSSISCDIDYENGAPTTIRLAGPISGTRTIS